MFGEGEAWTKRRRRQKGVHVHHQWLQSTHVHKKVSTTNGISISHIFTLLLADAHHSLQLMLHFLHLLHRSNIHSITQRKQGIVLKFSVFSSLESFIANVQARITFQNGPKQDIIFRWYGGAPQHVCFMNNHQEFFQDGVWLKLLKWFSRLYIVVPWMSLFSFNRSLKCKHM